MIKARITPLLILMVILFTMGCGQSRNATVGEGLFQKRKHQPGWHIDLRLKQAKDIGLSRVPRIATSNPPTVASLRTPMIAALPVGEFLASRSDEPLVPFSAPNIATNSAARDHPVVSVPNVRDQDPEQENLMPRKRLQPLAIPALLFALAGIYLAFMPTTALATTTLWILALLTVAITLAAVSLRRIRDHERSGKGFALAGLMIGLLGMIITVMVIIRNGGL